LGRLINFTFHLHHLIYLLRLYHIAKGLIASISEMTFEKIQPWRAHWTPQSGNPDIVAYQEQKGVEIIADGGSAGPPVEEGLPTVTKKEPVRPENRLCPHLKPITNPTL